jgi:hypothetical protein
VDGKPFFPIGAYTHDLSDVDWEFMQAAALGIRAPRSCFWGPRKILSIRNSHRIYG